MSDGHAGPEELTPKIHPDEQLAALVGDSYWRPLVDVFVAPDKVHLTIELPGVERSELSLWVGLKHVRVAGLKPLPGSVRSGVSFYSSEIPYGRFDLAVELPAAAEPATARASLAQGVLYVTLDRARPTRRTIPIE